jgi:hypothetical protein
MKRRADLIVVFKKLKSILKEYESQLTVRADFDSRYELWSEKDVIIGGKKRKEVFFAALIIQSSYIGFYFMPVYTNRDLKKVFGPELLATLKGKSCFHIKKVDAILLRQIKSALKKGFSEYKKNGWI